MRKALAIMATGLLIIAAGCDTNQPIGAGPQIISVTAQAFSLTEAVRIYDVWEDLDLDGQPDVDIGEIRCVFTDNLVNAPVPWEYSASISIIPAGTTDEIPIRSTTSDVDPFTNLTRYDPQTKPAASLPIQGRCNGGPSNGQFCQTDMMCDPDMTGVTCGNRVFHFLNGREVTTSSLDYIMNCTTLGSAIGVANILGETGSFEVEVSPGDTIVFRARKQLTADSFPYDEFLRPPNSAVFLNSTFAIDGNNVTPTGNPNSSGDEGAGYTASVGIR